MPRSTSFVMSWTIYLVLSPFFYFNGIALDTSCNDMRLGPLLAQTEVGHLLPINPERCSSPRMSGLSIRERLTPVNSTWSTI